MHENRDDMNESRLIQRILAGDQAAFQHLIETYRHLAWRTISVLSPNRMVAEDTLQDVWTDVWRGLPTFQRERAFRPWLLTIVTNRCYKNARRPVPVQQPLDTLAPEQAVATDEAPDRWLQLETRQELRTLLMSLPNEQQRVLELRYFADLDLAEIALVMETSVGTVKSRLHRALRHLREQVHPAKMAADF